MNKLFLPYELAVIAKEKGYNNPDLAYFRLSYEEEKEPFALTELTFFKERYDNHNFRLELHPSAHDAIVTAPLYQQIIDWFREKHNIRFKIEPTIKNKIQIFVNTYYWQYVGEFEDDYTAINAAIQQAFTLI